jgi:hypothetical protein
MLGAAIVITRPGHPKKNLLTPLPNILPISVPKIHPNVKISSLSQSVQWSLSSLFHHRNSVCINCTSSVRFYFSDLWYQIINIAEKKTEYGTFLVHV